MVSSPVAGPRCGFCGELAPGRLLAKGPAAVAICAACRVWARVALREDLLGSVQCGFCRRLRRIGGMTAIAQSVQQPDVGICNECLDFCDEFTDEELYGTAR